MVSNRGQNLRLHPDTGAVAATDGALNYADGTAPGVVAAAYTNNFAGATATELYVLDARNKTLSLQNPPNDGRLNVVGPLVISTSPRSRASTSHRTPAARWP